MNLPPKQTLRDQQTTDMAGWKMDPDWVDVFPWKKWDIPASYVSLQRV